MNNIDKINIIDEKIYFWQTCLNSVLEQIRTLEAGKEILEENNGDKEINIPNRISHGYEYIDMCNKKIAFLEDQKRLLTNQS